MPGNGRYHFQRFASAIRFIFFIWIADLITSATPTGDIVLTMNKAKLPPEASIAIGIAFSYIPVLKNEIGHVIEAQKSRGASFESKNPFKKIKAYIPVIVPGLFISILKGREIARTIEARGFTYNPEKRTYRKTIKLRTRDYVIITLSILLTIAVLYLKHSADGSALSLFSACSASDAAHKQAAGHIFRIGSWQKRK